MGVGEYSGSILQYSLADGDRIFKNLNGKTARYFHYFLFILKVFYFIF